MKPQELKIEYIRMRAEGKSYSTIAKALGLSKSTCTAWERELTDRINELKQEQLDELYDSYYMTKESRIKQLGDTLEDINSALDAKDLENVPADKLLDFKLKYTEALKAEYTGSAPSHRFTGRVTPLDIVAALGDLLNRIRAGTVTAEQASRESLVLSNLLKAYDTVELKAKLDTLEAILGGRQNGKRH